MPNTMIIGVVSKTMRILKQWWIWYGSLVLFLSLVMCQSPDNTNDMVTSPTTERLGFRLRTNDDYDSLVVVFIQCVGLPDKLPEVEFEGLDLDYWQVDEWACKPVSGDTTFSYTIIWNDDTLHDRIYIPPRLDSLHFDTTYIFSHIGSPYTSFSYAYDSVPSTCVFRLTSCNPRVVGFYVVSSQWTCLNGPVLPVLGWVTGSTYILPLDFPFLCDFDRIYFEASCMAFPKFVKGDRPSRETEKMYIYYEVCGPKYNASVSLYREPPVAYAGS